MKRLTLIEKAAEGKLAYSELQRLTGLLLNAIGQVESVMKGPGRSHSVRSIEIPVPFETVAMFAAEGVFVLSPDEVPFKELVIDVWS